MRRAFLRHDKLGVTVAGRTAELVVRGQQRKLELICDLAREVRGETDK
jgi:hypothetical protein